MKFTVHVSGTIPQDPATHMADFACYYRVLDPAGDEGWIYDLVFYAPDRVFYVYGNVTPFGAGQVGSTIDWSLRCTNQTWPPFTYHEDTGTLTVTP